VDFIKEDNRIYSLDENGKLIAEITFPNLSDTRVNIDHTFVDDSLRGRGVAAKLVLAAAETIRARKKKAVVTCPYAVKWFQKNQNFSDILEKTDISTHN
jgi:hypothetical protein